MRHKAAGRILYVTKFGNTVSCMSGLATRRNKLYVMLENSISHQ
jgi:hypothetical protein